MRKVPTAMIWLTLLVILCAFVIYPVWSKQVPDPLMFKPMTPQVFAGLIAWLFAVALFVERAVEVVIMVFRDQEADVLDEAEENATTAFKTATAHATAPPGGDPGKAAAVSAVNEAATALATAQHNKVVYRAETKKIALLTGFAFGIFVSLAGVRALQGLLNDQQPVGTLFKVADIVVTGAMLAGGSEGIHRMANAFNGFMDGLSARSDQVQRNAQKDLKPNSPA